jgi:hypothetical protein
VITNEDLVGAVGTEHLKDCGGKQGVADQSGAESGALAADSASNRQPAVDPDLQAVAAAWPALAANVKAAVLALLGISAPSIPAAQERREGQGTGRKTTAPGDAAESTGRQGKVS